MGGGIKRRRAWQSNTAEEGLEASVERELLEWTCGAKLKLKNAEKATTRSRAACTADRGGTALGKQECGIIT
jgi:hypothetical protein